MKNIQVKFNLGESAGDNSTYGQIAEVIWLSKIPRVFYGVLLLLFIVVIIIIIIIIITYYYYYYYYYHYYYYYYYYLLLSLTVDLKINVSLEHRMK